VAGSADDLAIKLGEAIHWCEVCHANHAQWIGKDGADTSGALNPRGTATELVKILNNFGLGDQAAQISIDQFSTHQLVAGLLTTYKDRFSDARHLIRMMPAISGPAPLRKFFATNAPNTGIHFDPVGKAAMARKVAEHCKTETQAIRALIQHGDAAPETCRAVVANLLRMLSHAEQFSLRNGVDFESSAYDNPVPVIGLLSRMQRSLEEAASSLDQGSRDHHHQYALDGATRADDLMTLDDLAKIAGLKPKTFRNSKVLGEPAIKGGGRGKRNKWHYLDIKLNVEARHGVTLPDLVEARQILRQIS
jgi:hypothetical protein